MHPLEAGILFRTHREVALVANQHDCHVGICVLPGILQPARQVVERLAPAVWPCNKFQAMNGQDQTMLHACMDVYAGSFPHLVMS